MFDFQNMLQKLRLNQIFNPSPDSTQSTFPQGGIFNPPNQPMPTDDGDNFDPSKMMSDLYHPETKNIDAFNSLASQYPEYKKPGKLRTIGAIGLATLSDLYGGKGSGRVAFDEMTGKTGHDEDVATWKAKLAPLENAATYERQSNNQGRQFATSMVNSEVTNRRNEKTAANNEDKTNISNLRAQVYQFKAQNPMAKIIAPPGGNIQAINPITGKIIMDFGPSGKMNEQDKINLEQSDRMALQDDKQAGDKTLQDDKQGAAADLEGIKQHNRITLKETIPGKAPTDSKTESPAATRTRKYTQAEDFINKNPQFKKYVKMDASSKSVEVTPPKGEGLSSYFSNGPTPEEHSAIMQGLGLETPTIQATNIAPPAPPTNTGRMTGAGPRGSGQQPIEKVQHNTKTGQNRTVISMDGGKTWTVKQ